MARAKRHRRVPAELREASGGLMQPSWETLAQDPGGGGGGGGRRRCGPVSCTLGNLYCDQNQAKDAEKEGCCSPLKPPVTKRLLAWAPRGLLVVLSQPCFLRLGAGRRMCRAASGFWRNLVLPPWAHTRSTQMRVLNKVRAHRVQAFKLDRPSSPWCPLRRVIRWCWILSLILLPSYWDEVSSFINRQWVSLSVGNFFFFFFCSRVGGESVVSY